MVRELIDREIECLRTNGVTEREITRAKAQIRGGLMLSLESTASRMGRIGKTRLLLGRVVTTEEVARRVEAIRLEDVNRVGREVLALERAARALLGPLEGMGGK